MRRIDLTQMGHRIRAKRIARGLTQQALAERLGAAQSSVNQWEAGKAEPRKHLAGIAEVLGTTTDFLLYGERGVTKQWGDDVRTRKLRELLTRLGPHLSDSEREGLAIALRDTDANTATIELVIRAIWGDAPKATPKG